MNVKFKNKVRAKAQAGMSLLEIIIVLGIIGTIAAGVVVLAQRALDNKAISDLNTNLNATKLAVVETFKTTGYVPADTAVLTMTAAELETEKGSQDPKVSLYRVGAISPQELTNPVSGNLFNITNQTSVEEVAATTAPETGRVFSITVDGLSSTQCAQVVQAQISQWDYVEVVANGGLDTTATAEMNAAGSVTTLRSLEASKRGIPSVTQVATACDSPNNAIVFASR